MQEVTSPTSSAATTFDQMRTSALVDTTSQSRAFSDFLGLMSRSSTSTSSQGLVSQINSVQDLNTRQDVLAQAGIMVAAAAPVVAVATAATETAAAEATVNPTTVSGPLASTTQAATTSKNSKSKSSAKSSKDLNEDASAAKNAAVSRTAFEEAKPLLLKAGLTEAEIADLSTRVQAGTLTWGQLVQTVGTHMTGSKQGVQLSASETTEMQSLFQRLGFATDISAQMAQSVAKGDGLKVLSSIQNKLSTMSDDTSLDLDKGELATFFKALNLPTGTAAKLTQLLGSESTVADMKNALATMGQAMQDQRAKNAASDTELAKNLGKIMEKDVAKSARDTTQNTTQTTASSSEPKVQFELKTKDTNDTGWFDQRQKNQQKTSDDVWRSFVAKVRTDESGTQQSTTTAAQGSLSANAATTAKDALDAASRSAQSTAAQQGKTSSTAQAKAYEKVAAPKVLDQVSEAMLKDLGQGRKQLTIQLDPENLGKVQVMLQVKGKEVNAVLQAEDSQTATMLASNLESIKKTLEDQGLTVQNLEVQAGLTSRQDQQAAFSADQHNQAQQQQEMSRVFSQLRMMREESDGMALDMQNTDMQAILADQGLHIIA